MKPQEQHERTLGPNVRNVVVVTLLGAALVAVVAYRLVPKSRARAAPPSAALASDAGSAEVLPVLAILEQPLPRWGSQPLNVDATLRDPFAAAGSYLEALSGDDARSADPPLPPPEPELTARDFDLKGILHDTDGAVASINGYVLAVGDEIQGYTVKAIGPYGVTLERCGRQVELSLPIKHLIEGH
ncbi:MAG: hypothetical protein JXB46_03860 [Candidatus Eisenbacteria bacterium]|nr:hypothetical protein [Candidatus Eisenbacteria bacterium]